MQLQVQSPELTLDAGQVVTLDDAGGLRIVSRIGTVWVTEEGSAKDYIVGPGDALLLHGRGRTVVQALQRAWISLAEATPAANDSY